MGSAKKSLSKRQRQERRAVVDIGSNSVRLVIYDGPRRAPIPICNEKALCGLGRDMTEEGRLNSDAVADALATLARFRRLLTEHGDPPVHVIATAAVREARDGKKFVEAVRKLDFDVNIISGEEEATLAALGVVSFVPGATGIVGDMGGGSLELVVLDKDDIKERVSLPIGPLSIMHASHENLPDAKKLIEKQLDSVKFLKAGDYNTLYSVGGAWRAVARIHMRLKRYPLPVLHHYELSSAQAIEICDLVSQQSRRSLEDIPGIPRRRIDTLPYAAMVLKSVLKRSGAKKVVISSGGVREGFLYQELSKNERKNDPFTAACHFYAKRLAPNSSHGDAVFSVIEPLFADDGSVRRRLVYATCLLIDIGAYFHPDLRAKQAFETALSAPFVGVAHGERVWTAFALYRRHNGRAAPLPDEQAIGLLSWEEQQSATKLGLALRFAAAFAPKVSAPLTGCRLEAEPGRLVFRAPADRQELMGEIPRKRLESLAAAYEAEAIEIYED